MYACHYTCMCISVGYIVYMDDPNTRAVVGGLGLFGTLVGSRWVYKTYLARVPTSTRLPNRFLRNRSMLGRVISVGDGDNFRFFHTPGGYLAGWGWLRKIPPVNTRKLSDKTMHIRLCGVDAPELAHFGKPAQPYGKEALEWLRSYILGRRVRVYPLNQDQYNRTVGDAYVWKLTGRKNVSKEMLRNGWAVVYEGKVGAEFNGNEAAFRKIESQARRWRRGQFAQRGHVQTPGEYKQKYKS